MIQSLRRHAASGAVGDESPRHCPGTWQGPATSSPSPCLPSSPRPSSGPSSSPPPSSPPSWSRCLIRRREQRGASSAFGLTIHSGTRFGGPQLIPNGKGTGEARDTAIVEQDRIGQRNPPPPLGSNLRDRVSVPVCQDGVKEGCGCVRFASGSAQRRRTPTHTRSTIPAPSERCGCEIRGTAAPACGSRR